MNDAADNKTAEPQDLLARAFLDVLAGELGSSAKPLLKSNKLDAVNELMDGDETESRISVRADIAAAAILVARAIGSEARLTRELRHGSPVVSITTHLPDLVTLVAEVIEKCAFGPDTKVEDGTRVSAFERFAYVIARDGTGLDHKPERGNDVVAAALHGPSPLVGIAPDPARHLPRNLMRAAEFHLAIGRMDAAAISLVVEAVTGTAPPMALIDPHVVRTADVFDLLLAVRRDRSPEECLRRLAEIVGKRGINQGPGLHELAGYGTAKKWGLELAADIDEYRKGKLDWASIEKGLLLAGPSGVGKTQYAKALAKTAGIPIVATSVADWNAAPYLSGTLSAMRKAFAQARRLAPCLLFVDELDGISNRATLKGEYVEYWSQIVNLLLELLAGVEDRPGVVVLGATNHPDRIDPAVRRAGRMDRTITIDKPTVPDLVGILRFHLKGELESADLMPIALAGRGGTGADVEAWTRRAKSKARRAKRSVTADDLMEEVRGDRKPMPERLRRVCALHEASHAVVACALGGFRIDAVSLHDTGGITDVVAHVDQGQTLAGLEALVVMLLAGRAGEAEFLHPDEITAGAGVGGEGSDFARATKICFEIETKFGLGTFGLVHLPDRIADIMLHVPSVVGLVKARLDRCFVRAREIVAANKIPTAALAGALERHGHLDAGEVEALLSRHVPEIAAPPSVPEPPGTTGGKPC